MLKQNISYKFLPALATLLCVCSAQAFNWHINIEFPIHTRPVRHVYPVHAESVCRVYDPPRARLCHSAVDSLINSIQHDFSDMHTALNCSKYSDLHMFARGIKNNWFSWVTLYRNAYGISMYDLEAISDEVHDILFGLSRIQNSRMQLCNYQYRQLRTSIMDLADIIGSSWRYRTSDIRDITMYLSQIQRILTDI